MIKENHPDNNVGNIEYIRKQDVLNLPKTKIRNFNGEVIEESIDIDDVEELELADVLPYSISYDGTLTITVPKGMKVDRVLVQIEGTRWGGLFYAD